MPQDTHAPAVDQRVIITLRGHGLDTYETSAIVESVGEEGMFHIRFRTDVERDALRTGAGVTVDRPLREGLWRLQTRVVGVDEAAYVRAAMSSWRGQAVTLNSVGEARHVDVRRFHRLQVWTPVRYVVIPKHNGMQEADWEPDEVSLERARDELSREGRLVRAFSLGAGGLAFVPHEYVKTGQALYLHIDDPALDIHTFGRVVWSRREGSAAVHAGVSFAGLADEDQDSLLDYVLAMRRERRHLSHGVDSAARAAPTG